MSESVRTVELDVPAGTGRDALLGMILERVPADARLMWTQTYQDVPDHVLTFEEDLPGPPFTA